MLQDDPPLVCAHGGDVTAAAPNTMAALNAALEAGAQCIEVDVALTKDGSLVCLHMRQLTQWTDQPQLQVNLKRKQWELQRSYSAFDMAEVRACNLQVGDLTLAEVLDLQGSQNETVPLLENVIRLLHHRVTRFIIDIKLHVRFLATCLICWGYRKALPSTQKRKPSSSAASIIIQEVDGQLQDEEASATAVSNLVQQYHCTSCLLWCSSSDAVVMQLAAAGIPPPQLGYIVLPAGRSSSIKTEPFWLQDAQVWSSHT